MIPGMLLFVAFRESETECSQVVRQADCKSLIAGSNPATQSNSFNINRCQTEGNKMKFTEAITKVLSLTTDEASTRLSGEACEVIEDFMEQWSGAIKEMEERG